jgi:Zn-dependent protease with chaperone function
MAAPPRATLDFFAAQEAARRRTAVLVAWFALAWLGTIALVYLGLGVLLASGLLGVGRGLAFGPALLAVTAAGVTLVTLAGAAWHGTRLAKGGGHAVAAMVGGVAVDRATRDPAERRLVNVVEEMAIASGLPVPALYVLPGEAAINAFAAGFTPERAVVAVTKGALDALGRDELQGVVAHELSHVLNGDARLNLRLVALVGGITVLALVGRSLARGLGRRGVRARGDGRVRVLLALVGACLWVAGSIGAFFGRVIRAAVSRQREHLADAAAVQFTRNPEGLAGALAKIALQGSALGSAQAPEVAHLFFANGLRSRWLATHPPIEERIRRIAPAGPARSPRAARAAAPPPPAASARVPWAGAAAGQGLAAAAALASSAGHPGPQHVAWAAELLARLPPELAASWRAAQGARAICLALLADPDPAARVEQLGAIVDPAARAEASRLAAVLSGSSRHDRMALLDLALPALDALPAADAATLVQELAALAAADGRTTVFEWAVQRIVERRVAPSGRGARGAAVRAHSLDEVQVEALELLSVLAWLGASDEAGAQAALDAGTGALGIAGRWRPLPRDRVRAARLEAALARLDEAAPGLKERLLGACAACVLADGRVVAAEAEVVRAVAASLGVPLPPLAPALGSPLALGSAGAA